MNEDNLTKSLLTLIRQKGADGRRVDLDTVVNSVDQTAKGDKTKKKKAMETVAEELVTAMDKWDPRAASASKPDAEKKALLKEIEDLKDQLAKSAQRSATAPEQDTNTCPAAKFQRPTGKPNVLESKRVKEINRTNLDEMVSTLNLTREEKIKVAGITAELKDLCTQQPTVSRMEATAAQK